MNADWHRAQIEQASETFRFLVGLVVAMWSLIIGADAALVVLGATAQNRPVLLVAATFPLVCLVAWVSVSRSLVTLAYIALRSEARMGNGELGVVQIYGRTILPRLEKELTRLVALDDPDAALYGLRRVAAGRRWMGQGISIFLVFLSAAQFVGAVVLLP